MYHIHVGAQLILDMFLTGQSHESAGQDPNSTRQV